MQRKERILFMLLQRKAKEGTQIVFIEPLQCATVE